MGAEEEEEEEEKEATVSDSSRQQREGSTCDHCIYNIPICGGFCAPTKNPDDTCLRHFSNEYTLPGAAVFMQLAPCIETTGCCRMCGRIGSEFGEIHRRSIALCASLVSVVALFLTIIATCGISTNPDVLQSAYWVHATDPRGFESFMNLVMKFDKVDCDRETPLSRQLCISNATAAGFDKQESAGPEANVFVRVVNWNDEVACNRTQTPAICAHCKDNLPATSSMIVSVITSIPTLTTDLQRATRFGDVNCQAAMARITGVISLFSGLSSLFAFYQACYVSLPTDLGGGQIESDLGVGFYCLMVAVLLKLVDICIHFVIPTPAARWRETHATTLEGYMMEAEIDDSSGDESTTTARSLMLSKAHKKKPPQNIHMQDVGPQGVQKAPPSVQMKDGSPKGAKPPPGGGSDAPAKKKKPSGKSRSSEELSSKLLDRS